MKFKFNDEVQVKNPEFYKGAKGVVLSFDRLENTYRVLLAFNCYKEFNEEDLKLVPKRSKK